MMEFRLHFHEICARGLINNNPALVKIMASLRIGNKTLSEATVAYFADTHMRHSALELKYPDKKAYDRSQ